MEDTPTSLVGTHAAGLTEATHLWVKTQICALSRSRQVALLCAFRASLQWSRFYNQRAKIHHFMGWPLCGGLPLSSPRQYPDYTHWLIGQHPYYPVCGWLGMLSIVMINSDMDRPLMTGMTKQPGAANSESGLIL